MLGAENPIGEIFRVVTRLDVNNALKQDRPTVEFHRHQMHTGTGLGVSCIKRALVRVEAWVLG